MGRANYSDYLWYRDPSTTPPSARVLAGAVVTVLRRGTTLPVSPLYLDDTTGATQTNPLTSAADGAIGFYLSRSQRVDLHIQSSSPSIDQTVTVDAIDPTGSSPAYLDIPPGALDTWFADKALAIAGTGVCALVNLGISTGQGFKANPTLTAGYFGLTRAWLLQQGARYADFYGVINSAGALGAAASLWNGPFPWVLNTGGAVGTLVVPGGGYERYARWAAYTSGILASYTDQDPGTAIEVHHFNAAVLAGSTFTFTTTDDPGTGAITFWPGTFGGTYTCTRGAAVGSGYSYTVALPAPSLTGPLLKVRISGLNLAKHTVAFTGQSVDAALQLCGIAGFSGSAGGFAFANLGSFGLQACARMWAAVPNEGFMWPQGCTTGAMNDASPTFPAGASLYLYELFPNDAVAAFGPDMTELAARLHFNAMRRGRDNGSIGIVLHSCPDPISGDFASGWLDNATDWPAYRAAANQVADEFANVWTVDFASYVGELGNHKGYQLNDVHLLNDGHAALAALVESAL